MQKPDTDQSLVDMAVELATGAGALTRKWFDRGSIDFETKADGSPVTEADKAAERYLREQITLAFPTDSIIGEEEVDRAGTSGRSWVIDPIDGTKSFTRGVPLYGTLLAVIDEHGPAIGIIVLPALDEVIAAGRGLGCTHNGRPASVSELDGSTQPYVMTSGPEYWPAQSRLAEAASNDVILRTWGDAYGYALVATGRAEAMIDPAGVNIWDIAPMQVIIPEAGGMVSDEAGEPWTPGRSFVASNGHVHDHVRAAMFDNAEPADITEAESADVAADPSPS